MRTIKRRRREAKTDYRARLSLIQSKRIRLVIRKTNRYIVVQLVESALAQDKIIYGMTSKDLLSNGWPKEKAGSLKSRGAAYAIGYLLAKKAKDVKEAIVDLGMQRNIKRSKLYAAVKGAVDAGLNIPHSPEILPKLEEMENAELAQTIIKKIK